MYLIDVIIDVMPVDPVLLCLDCCCAQGSELTPLAEAAFKEIFKRHSANSAMDIHDMVRRWLNALPLFFSW